MLLPVSMTAASGMCAEIWCMAFIKIILVNRMYCREAREQLKSKVKRILKHKTFKDEAGHRSAFHIFSSSANFLLARISFKLQQFPLNISLSYI